MSRLLFRWRHWLLLVVCLGGLGVFLAYQNQRERNNIEARETERLTLQSKVIEENLSRQLLAVNRSVESIIAELLRWGASSAGHSEGLQHLKSMEAAMTLVRTFLVLDATGKVTLSNREELIGRNFYQRDYFQVPLLSKDAGRLFVSPPFKTVLGAYAITLTRVVINASGNFAGAVVATMDPLDVQILLNSVLYADDMEAILLHGDGRVFVGAPAANNALEKDLTGIGSVLSRHLSSKRPLSQFRNTAFAGGEERLHVLRSIQPAVLLMDKPLVIAVSRNSSSLFVQWRHDVQNQFLAYLVLVAFSGIGVILYRRQLVRQRISNQRLKLATEATGVGIWEFDLTSRRYHWDAAMFALFGLSPQVVNTLNNDWRQLLLPGELERMKEATRGTIHQGQAFDLTFQIRRKDGQVRFMHNRAALYEGDFDARTRLIGSTEDVTERKMREADLRVAATVFDCQESMVVTDASNLILRVNRAFTELFGYTSQDIVGVTPQVLQSGRHDSAFYAAMWDSINRDGVWQGEIWNRRKNGEVFPVWLTISAVHNEEGLVSHFVATHTDITLRKVAEDEIKHLAFHDPLTQLPNRRLLHDRLHQAMILAKRDQKRLALMFIDLDKFKPVNDDFGHQVGDELLQTVAQRLQACVRESDTVARLGGDEFVLLLPVIEVVQDAMAVAGKVHLALLQPFALSKGPPVRISSSTGIAIYPEHGRDEIELIKHADAAMYQAKAAGRDRVVLFVPEYVKESHPE